MDIDQLLQEAVVVSFSTFLSYGLNQLFRIWTYRYRISVVKNGKPEERWNTKTNPLVGGITFYFLFLIGLVSIILWETSSNYEALIPVFLIGSLGFFIGLVDDAFNTIPFLKLLGQIVTAFLFLLFGIQFQLFESDWLNKFLTVLWVVGIMNSFNMIDNMDGVSGSIALILFIFFSFLLSHSSLENWILIVLVGALIGFLFLNWYPSKIFMGDSGSQFLGALIAYFGIRMIWQLKGHFKTSEFFPVLFFYSLPFIALITDTTFVTIGRFLRKQPPYIGGRDHLSHCFAFLGFSPRWIPLFFALLTLLGSLLYWLFYKEKLFYIGFLFYLGLWLILAIPYYTVYKQKFWLYTTSKRSKKAPVS